MAEHCVTHIDEIQALGKDIFTDFTPDEPNQVIVLNEYNGSGIATGMKNFSNRSVQVTVRATATAQARLICWKIFQLFNNEETRVIHLGERMTMMYPRQTPFKMKVDAQNRVTWAFNLGVSTQLDM